MGMMHSFLGVALILFTGSSARTAMPNSCVRVIESWRDAGDCQTNELTKLLTWADGFTKRTTGMRGKWSDIQMNGPCPKYSTTLREWRIAPVRGNRQIVDVKGITRHVDSDGQFTGDYSVGRSTYTCEQRGGQWRIFSQEITQREDLVNQLVAAKHKEKRRGQ